MLTSIAGFLAWGLLQWFSHYMFHTLIRRGWRKGVIDGEVQHHSRHDKPSHDTVLASFPLESALLLALIPTIWISESWFYGVIVAAVIDDISHRMYHYERLYFPFNVFYRLHSIHHARHDCNYALATGFVWDMIGGTFRWKR